MIRTNKRGVTTIPLFKVGSPEPDLAKILELFKVKPKP